MVVSLQALVRYFEQRFQEFQEKNESSNIEADRAGFLRVRKDAEGALINIHTNEGAQGC